MTRATLLLGLFLRAVCGSFLALLLQLFVCRARHYRASHYLGIGILEFHHSYALRSSAYLGYFVRVHSYDYAVVCDNNDIVGLGID